MNDLLQKHGCANVFSVPEGLRELMSDITREVLREQPPKMFDFISNYLSALLITREHGIMAVKILDDLCDCKPSVSEHLLLLGINRDLAESMAQVIKEEIEGSEPVAGKEKVKETQIIKRILARSALDEEMAAGVCQVARNAYKDYWYRKKLLEKNMTMHPEEPWEIAAQHTLDLYKRTKPSFNELNRATERIQAAYKGYHVRKNVLRHLKPKHKKHGPKVSLPGPPLDIAGSREIDLGPIINIKVKDDNVGAMFDEDMKQQLGLKYDVNKTIMHVQDKGFVMQQIKSESSKLTVDYPAKRRLSSQSPIPNLISDGSWVPTSHSLHSPLKSGEALSPRKSEASSIADRPKSLTPLKTIRSSQRGRGVSICSTDLHLDRPSVALDLDHISGQPSHIPSICSTRSNQSSGTLNLDHTGPPHKISFAAVPTEIIPNDITPVDDIDDDIAENISEDIRDDRSEGDGASVSTASAVSSAPASVYASDMEDANVTDDGEE